MSEVDEFLGRYAARHYRFHAERSNSRDLSRSPAATTRISRKPLPEKSGKKAHRRRPAMFAGAILVAFLSVVLFLTRDDGGFPYRPGSGSETVIIDREGYSFAVDPDPKRVVSLWVGYRLVQSDRENPTGRVISDPVAELNEAFFDELDGFVRSKMLPADHSGYLEDSRQLMNGALIAPHTRSSDRVKFGIDNTLKKMATNTEVHVLRGPVYGTAPLEHRGLQIPDKYFCIAITKDGTRHWFYANTNNSKKIDTELSQIEAETGLDFSDLPGREVR